MTSKNTGDGLPNESPRSSGSEYELAAGPDLMLGVWASWMGAASRAGSDMLGGVDGAGRGEPWWQVTQDKLLGGMLAGGMQQLNEALRQDPLLRTLDQMWNANPFREIVPVDWAEVARALRTVWLRVLAQPGTPVATAAELNASLWRSAFEAWNEAGQRWWTGTPVAPPARGGVDKRFAAPEWHTNPAYRVLKEAYLLASDWLLKQGQAADDLDEKERQRLDFHLRQFVDAMSPTLLLASNPAALRRAMETGGVSLAAGLRNLQEDLKAGRLSMVDLTAFAPGRNLALSPGKVVLRNKLIELIQYAPSTPDVHATPLLILVLAWVPVVTVAGVWVSTSV